MDKLIITAALTGAITVPTQTPYLPYTVEGIAADAVACAKAGAAAVHIHARNPRDGAPSPDPEIVKDIATHIKAGTDVVIGITTGGGMGMTPEQRLRGATLCRPEIASFNLGSINFSIHPVAKRFQPEDWKFDWEPGYVKGTENFIFANTFGSMEVFARTMAQMAPDLSLKPMMWVICIISNSWRKRASSAHLLDSVCIRGVGGNT